MFRRWLICALCAVIAFVTLGIGISTIKGDRPPSHRVQPGNLVVLALPGLTWSDINPDTTPALWQLSQRSAVGNQLVRVISAHACSNAAWVTLGSGTRTPLGYSPPEAPASGINSYCPNLVTGVADVPAHTYLFPQWGKWAQDARRRHLPSTMGLVASTLEADGQCVSAVGEPAALGAANRQGKVSHYYPTLQDADLRACPVTFIGMSSRRDANVQYVLDHAAPDTTFLITGLTDDERPESPRAVLLSGPTVGTGLLRSRSTRQPGLVQTTDLSAFIMERVKDAPLLAEGRPLSVERRSSKVALRSVNNTQTLLRTEHNLVTPFFVWVGIITLAAALVGCILSWTARRRGTGWAVAASRRWWAFWAALLAAVPAATFLANLHAWYLHEHALVWLGICVLACALPVALLALLGPWRRWTPGPATFLALFTATVLSMDAIQGSPLQLVSVLGLQPVYGGRFYGMGNVGYAIFMSSVIFAAAMLGGRYRALKRPRLALLTVLALVLPAVLVEAMPQWGNDGGGSAAFVPALVYLAIRARGARITLTRLVLALLGGIAFTMLVGWLDYLRGPERRTHLGDVFAGLIDDGQVNPVKRILYANWTMMTQHWFGWLSPAILVVCALLVAFPTSRFGILQSLYVRIPMLRHGLIALIIMLGVGFLANDSGTSIPPVGALVTVPLLVLTASRMSSPASTAAPRDPLARAEKP